MSFKGINISRFTALLHLASVQNRYKIGSTGKPSGSVSQGKQTHVETAADRRSFDSMMPVSAHGRFRNSLHFHSSELDAYITNV